MSEENINNNAELNLDDLDEDEQQPAAVQRGQREQVHKPDVHGDKGEDEDHAAVIGVLHRVGRGLRHDIDGPDRAGEILEPVFSAHHVDQAQPDELRHGGRFPHGAGQFIGADVDEAVFHLVGQLPGLALLSQRQQRLFIYDVC